MRVFSLRRRSPYRTAGEAGASLLETVLALALLGIIGAAFLSAIATTSSARLVSEEHDTAKVLAETQMEYIRQQDYAFSYNLPAPGPEYGGYSTIIDVDNMRNGNIQKITITVRHHNKDIMSLQSYKANR